MLSVFDQDGQNLRMDKFKFIDMRALCQDMGLNKTSGDGPLTVSWLLESWRWLILGRMEMPRLPWQMNEEGIEKQTKVDT